MLSFSTEAKVGLFVIVGFVILAYMIISLGKFHFVETSGYQLWALFDNAIGLKRNTPVEMAGVQVGVVTNIELDHGRARLSFRINPKVQLAVDTTVYIRMRGVLGDKYVALESGSFDEGLFLRDGDQITKVKMSEDLDQLIHRLVSIAEDVKDITVSLRGSIASQESQQNIKEFLSDLRSLTNFFKLVISDNQDRINKIMKNISRFTNDISEISNINKRKIFNIIHNFLSISDQLDCTSKKLSLIIEKIDRGYGSIGLLLNDSRTVDDLNATLASLKQISKKIEDGRGSIGKLINDEYTAIKIEEVLTGINDHFTRADAWKIFLDYRGDYFLTDSYLKSIFNVRLYPKSDKFYIFGLVSNPVGRHSEKLTAVTHWLGNQSWQTMNKEISIDKNAFKWNIQLGRRLYDLTVRAGLLESQGGIGLDYYLFNDDFKITFEAYDFQINERPHIKFSFDWRFWRYFFLTAGIDDFVSEWDRSSSIFIGGGLTFYDDDLKFLLTTVPKP